MRLVALPSRDKCQVTVLALSCPVRHEVRSIDCADAWHSGLCSDCSHGIERWGKPDKSQAAQLLTGLPFTVLVDEEATARMRAQEQREMSKGATAEKRGRKAMKLGGQHIPASLQRIIEKKLKEQEQ